MSVRPAELADAEDRFKAVRFLERNIVVEAGAGTGKTTLLIERLLWLLLGQGLPVEKVVALTFTEKAAGEIKVRLAAALERVVRGDKDSPAAEIARATGLEDGELRLRASTSLERLDRAVLSTIHGFASRLLKLFPLEAGVDPGAEVDTGPELEEVFEEEWALWLDAELTEESPRAERWVALLKAVELDELAALARQLGEAKLDPERLEAPPGTAAKYLRLAEEAEGLAAAHPPAKGRASNKALDALAAAAAAFKGLARLLEGKKPGSVPELPDFTKPAGWEDEEFARAKALARIASISNPANELLLREALDLLGPFARRLREGYARRGWISFDGLLVKARNLVKQDARVREALKAEFATFLIDEFQDTDPLQGELLLFLAEKPGRSASDWRKVVLEPGRLFVVGDPKQSIYRFRGADIAAFGDFVGLMREQGAEFCRLTSNFRSRPEILDVVNGLMTPLMRPRPGFQPDYAAVTSARPTLSTSPLAGEGRVGGAAVELLVVPESAGLAAEIRAAEAEAVADWIAERRGVSLALKDVAVLLRSMTSLRAYLEALKARDLPYVVEGEKSFFQSQEVLDFFNLLHAIDEPENAVALAGVLRSPLAGLTDVELLELKRRSALDYRRPIKDMPVYERLRRLHERSGKVPVGELLEEIFEDPMLLGPAAVAYHREQTLANLLKFRRLASEEGDRRGLTLKEFTRRLERSVGEWKDEGESPLADESFDAVRLLTIHKSKGLEFPVVILPNLGAAIGGAAAPALRIDWTEGAAGLRLGRAGNAAMGVIEDVERRKEADETLRLLYVALTRAKDRLVLAGSEPRPGSLGQWLERAEAWPAAGAARMKAGAGVIAVTEVPPLEPVREKRAFEGQPGLEGLEPAAYAAACREREERFAAVRPVFLRPSAERAEHAPLRRRSEEEEGSAPADLVGTVCHRVLETWDFKGRADLGSAVRAAAAGAAAEHPAVDWSEVEKEVLEVLRGFLGSELGKELASAEILGREVPFLYPEGGQVVRGVIDLLYRKGGALWVADYKTDKATSKEAKERSRAYAPQADRYLEAVRRGLGPARFKLLFLRPAVAVDL